MECLIYNCKLKVASRGLCQQHYVMALSKIKRNLTTWDELVNLGMAKPKKARTDKGEALISFETQLANARVNGAEWGERHKEK